LEILNVFLFDELKKNSSVAVFPFLIFVFGFEFLFHRYEVQNEEKETKKDPKKRKVLEKVSELD
jgi:hypothetical protein